MKLNPILEELGQLKSHEEKRLNRLMTLQRFLDPESHSQSVKRVEAIKKADLGAREPFKNELIQTKDEKPLKRGTQVNVKGKKGPHSVIKLKGNNYIVRSPHGGVISVPKSDVYNPWVPGETSRTNTSFKVGDIVKAKGIEEPLKIVKRMGNYYSAKDMKTGFEHNILGSELTRANKGPAPFGGTSEHFYTNKEARALKKSVRKSEYKIGDYVTISKARNLDGVWRIRSTSTKEVRHPTRVGTVRRLEKFYRIEAIDPEGNIEEEVPREQVSHDEIKGSGGREWAISQAQPKKSIFRRDSGPDLMIGFSHTNELNSRNLSTGDIAKYTGEDRGEVGILARLSKNTFKVQRIKRGVLYGKPFNIEGGYLKKASVFKQRTSFTGPR